MRRLFILCCVLLFCFSTSAFSGDEAWYAGGNIGLAMLSDSDITEEGVSIEVEFDAGFNLAGVLGYDFGEMRLEGEIGWQKNDFDKASAMGIGIALTGDMSVLSLLINGYYDLDTGTAFSPFISAGIGFAKVDANDLGMAGDPETFDDDDTVIAGQIGVGVSYAATETVAIDAKYRFLMTSDPEFDDVEAEAKSHNIILGVRFCF